MMITRFAIDASGIPPQFKNVDLSKTDFYIVDGEELVYVSAADAPPPFDEEAVRDFSAKILDRHPDFCCDMHGALWGIRFALCLKLIHDRKMSLH
jgi:hypothetical protein